VRPALTRILPLALAAAACSGDPSTGPAEVAWDRDTCEHCYMTVGDRRAAAQVRLDPGGPAHFFDDLGCALLFLDEKQRRQDFAELWVRDREEDRWLDGRIAHYVEVSSTPMEYGFAAVSVPSGASLDETWDIIREMEDERRSTGP